MQKDEMLDGLIIDTERLTVRKLAVFQMDTTDKDRYLSTLDGVIYMINVFNGRMTSYRIIHDEFLDYYKNSGYEFTNIVEALESFMAHPCIDNPRSSIVYKVKLNENFFKELKDFVNKEIVEYCNNDIISTEKAFNNLKEVK